jgi:hypothetical protein
MKMKFTRAWRAYRKGQTIDVPGGLAQQLLAMRVAVKDHQGDLIETAAVEPAVETADATPKRRGRRAVSKLDQTDGPGR